MTTTIKYIGAASKYEEIAVTGKPSVWKTGQLESRDDSEALLLLATGLFAAPEAVVRGVAPVGGLVVLDIWAGTQAQYNALTPDANTLYVIVP